VVSTLCQRAKFDSVPPDPVYLDAGVAGPLPGDRNVLGPCLDLEDRPGEAAVLFGHLAVVFEPGVL
jgi:hypothetical protein